ncbi:hypothetical protein [Pyxidicoccus trucidator]|uniref:hypothetical protein n=1 Tax=Pyxidicoccus trucidator TaxID=2709662 RepID=UPI001F07E5B4|nr:hypothetical protein [Pyxidicoccus trucidator]
MEFMSSAVSSITERVMPRPALFTQTSMRPKRASAASRRRSMSSRRVTYRLHQRLEVLVAENARLKGEDAQAQLLLELTQLKD